MSAVRAFQRKLEVFKSDLQEGLLHFPKLLEQTKGDNRPQNHVGFLEKLIENFKTRFDDFRLGKQVLLYIENPFLVRNVREFSAEAQQIFPWASAASLQSPSGSPGLAPRVLEPAPQNRPRKQEKQREPWVL
ncbi:General transcription factor II-I repeat domain containing protein 2A [Dissostichus eleginoides]|uniref:General transcription factor II-I repeat domain containing protein 2A n=1 Tax=Dissostichus eleginoides TaxID=100907 RepID=A0AAD9F8T0_DISEL|nr:General transcription factor II-I repeat domain containing protein 2A [Dissostichus eleginoides]